LPNLPAVLTGEVTVTAITAGWFVTVLTATALVAVSVLKVETLVERGNDPRMMPLTTELAAKDPMVIVDPDTCLLNIPLENVLTGDVVFRVFCTKVLAAIVLPNVPLVTVVTFAAFLNVPLVTVDTADEIVDVVDDELTKVVTPEVAAKEPLVIVLVLEAVLKLLVTTVDVPIEMVGPGPK
jgi:hypothetical protein